ncbi:hypothetical protein [Streptomyces sp. NBC_01304]|uniref:hypothetical protein n=1 Tax=Streptomyces sp. NBC_01304 TaxID=2903818 RepID=UPI002E0FF33B|nr:hypothetical protein OG430_36215 [Streptomyces sp. NBC_01304]
MSAHLTDTARRLAKVLWTQHTVYRDRTGGVVIRADHIERWISLAATGTRGNVLIRAGRLLDGGTTAPARVEAVMPLSTGIDGLAATCRRLLADTAEVSEVPSRHQPRTDSGTRSAKRRRTPRRERPRRQGRGRYRATWVIAAAAAVAISLYAYSAYQAAGGR